MPRSNQTKRLLAQSLQEIMVTTPLEKISVNDIVDHAGVGRNTFYYHFEDKYDLVNWYFQNGITGFLVERSAYSSWEAMLDAIVDYLEQNRVFYCNALAYNGQNSLQEYVFEYLCSIFRQRAKEMMPNATPDQYLNVGRFYAGADPVGAGRYENTHCMLAPVGGSAFARKAGQRPARQRSKMSITKNLLSVCRKDRRKAGFLLR